MEQISNTEAALRPGIVEKFNGLLARRPVIMQLLRFGAIGVLNTALDFLILNFVSKTLGITSGLKLGQINIIGFSLAVVQSYLWNRHWAFGSEQAVSLWKNFVRLALVGALGALAFILALLGAKISAPQSYYLIILAIYVIFQFVLWQSFGLSKTAAEGQQKNQFIAFILVSIIGLVINSLVLAFVSKSISLSDNVDLNKNLAKLLATLLSLVWNFIGYKIFVFKK